MERPRDEVAPFILPKISAARRPLEGRSKVNLISTKRVTFSRRQGSICTDFSTEDNIRDKSEPPVTYSNGETMRQILARSKHTLMMAQNKWTDIQRHRANILFKHYPILKSAYQLAMELRRIFNLKISPTKALGKMNEWYEKIMALGNTSFRSVIKTFKNHAPTIINYFRRRATNASAEAFNSKVKIFRSQMRGVRDRDFFIFRLVKLYA